MNISLSESGTEILANYKNIYKRLEFAWKKFENIRDPFAKDVIDNDDEEKNIIQSSASNRIPAEPAKRRVVVVTICLNDKVSSNDEAYENLLSALLELHNDSHLLKDNDLICYNIGSPLLKSYLRSDTQR